VTGTQTDSTGYKRPRLMVLYIVVKPKKHRGREYEPPPRLTIQLAGIAYL